MYRALCVIYYLDKQMHSVITVNVYFVKYSDRFRCIYIIFRESFLVYAKVTNQ